MATIAGLFENRDQAQRAIEALKEAGFRGEDISVAMRDKGDAKDIAGETGAKNATEAGVVGGGLLGGLAGFLVGIGALAIPGIGPIVAAGPLVATLTGAGVGAATGGLIGALVEAGIPEEEARYYQQGVERGNVLVTVNAPSNRENEARRILQQYGMQTASNLGRQEMTHHNEQSSSSYPFNESDFRQVYDQSPYRSRYTWEQVRPGYEYGWTSYRDDWQGQDWNTVRTNLEKNWTGPGRFSDYEDVVRAGYERRANYRPTTRSGEVTGEQVIPVVEEEIAVGKREVETGGARVNVDVEEKPVEEQVTLREENVRVERRPVDRELTDADATAFKEGTFEVRERAEQAVVDKRARVVEEVVIGKDVQERTETIRDTVRRTNVDVEELPGSATTSAATSSAATSSSVRRFEDYNNDFRSNYSSKYANSGYSYEQYTPAYRYGYNLATDKRYGNSNWNEVEKVAHRDWENTNKGTWEDFKDSIRYAWEKVRGRA